MGEANYLLKVVNKINLLPEFARSRALTLFFGRMVPFSKTTGAKIEELTRQRCVISLKNQKRVQNHIGGVHAIASLVLAESATGFMTALNVPDTRVPLVKSLHADYVRRAKGDMRVTATLTDEQLQLIETTDKGEVSVAVEIRDSANKEPIKITMIWAWTPKPRARKAADAA